MSFLKPVQGEGFPIHPIEKPNTPLISPRTSTNFMPRSLPLSEKTTRERPEGATPGINASPSTEVQEATSENSYITKTSILSGLGKGVKGILGATLVFAGGTGMVATKGISLLFKAVQAIATYGALAVSLPVGVGVGILLIPVASPIIALYSYSKLNTKVTFYSIIFIILKSIIDPAATRVCRQLSHTTEAAK